MDKLLKLLAGTEIAGEVIVTIIEILEKIKHREVAVDEYIARFKDAKSAADLAREAGLPTSGEGGENAT